jgi:hypothetical protein
LEGDVRPNGQEKAYKTRRAKAKPWLAEKKKTPENGGKGCGRTGTIRTEDEDGKRKRRRR